MKFTFEVAEDYIPAFLYTVVTHHLNGFFITNVFRIKHIHVQTNACYLIPTTHVTQNDCLCQDRANNICTNSYEHEKYKQYDICPMSSKRNHFLFQNYNYVTNLVKKSDPNAAVV